MAPKPSIYYSDVHPNVFLQDGRRVARQILSCFSFADPALKFGQKSLLDVGASDGLITHHLGKHVKSATGIDPDATAIKNGIRRYRSRNFTLRVFNGTSIPYPDNSFDLLVFRRCYQYVSDLEAMMDGIFRVLVPGGYLYLEATNRLTILEPDYQIPLIHFLPPTLARWCISRLGHQEAIFSRYRTWWGLQSLSRRFRIMHLTPRILTSSTRFNFAKLFRYNWVLTRVPPGIFTLIEPLLPTWIWILQKPTNPPNRKLRQSSLGQNTTRPHAEKSV